ncbi:hypothetical protein SCP_0606700 [Sparassis crispa]|uniref:Methyltransferase domain-containing protein n=1 Tax=Sparassis crispa TaxID=139825 RepID=A0A401GR13_9APHY|nr:hypothetical protein SCP_0606700 [Sparassis crispa]GBE84691.1 hypothetical protein SCP_0606700 [Sparassis crispa]
MSDPQHITLDSPRSIANIYLHERKDFDVVLGQIEERVELMRAWDIQPGENVLEIGCGQGDCTVTLAAAVGEKGTVTAIDPARLDYGERHVADANACPHWSSRLTNAGSPYNLGQAQAHLLASPLGGRMKFVKADPLAFLKDTSEMYDTAVLAHCIYYFASPSVFSAILWALAPRVKRICLAEYALTASDPRAVPHVLAALTHASLQCRIPHSESNVRTVLSPRAMRAAAKGVGLHLVKESTIVPPEKMYDGRWEVSTVVGQAYGSKIEVVVKDARERAAVVALRDSVRAAVDALKMKGEKVHTMDVWIATYLPPSGI